jgi:hypothetical protein
MVFVYVRCYLFGGNEMLAAFYMWKWSLHIVYVTIMRIVGPKMTDCGVDQSRIGAPFTDEQSSDVSQLVIRSTGEERRY